MFGSFLPSLWSSSNQSVLRSREPTPLCNQVPHQNLKFPTALIRRVQHCSRDRVDSAKSLIVLLTFPVMPSIRALASPAEGPRQVPTCGVGNVRLMFRRSAALTLFVCPVLIGALASDVPDFVMQYIHRWISPILGRVENSQVYCGCSPF